MGAAGTRVWANQNICATGLLIGRPTSTILLSAPYGSSAAHQLLPPGAWRVWWPPLSPQRGPPHFSLRFR